MTVMCAQSPTQRQCIHNTATPFEFVDGDGALQVEGCGGAGMSLH